MAVERSLTKLGAPIFELDSASAEQFSDAEVLLRNGRYAAAIIHGLYALEIKLKVLICRRLELQNLPQVFQIHDLEALMLHAGLARRIKSVRRPRSVAKNWEALLQLSREIGELRYIPDPKWDERVANQVLHQLRDSPHGVLPWLSKQASRKTR
jgi:hypothetical protein